MGARSLSIVTDAALDVNVCQRRGAGRHSRNEIAIKTSFAEQVRELFLTLRPAETTLDEVVPRIVVKLAAMDEPYEATMGEVDSALRFWEQVGQISLEGFATEALAMSA